MNEIENKIDKEVIKNFMKRCVDNNPYLLTYEKEIQKSKIDVAADQADRIENLISLIKYLGI